MSIWTHVNGNIRIDSINRGLTEEIQQTLGKIITFEDSDYTTNLPCGSEGSIEYKIWENPDVSDLTAYSISIFGDLRDYENTEEIKNWFIKILKDFCIRDAILTITVEENNTIILIYDEEIETIKEINK